MTTYYCKCGKTFSKNTTASTTGNRMPDYGPQHECWGCPFVKPVSTWDRMTDEHPAQNYECRGCKNTPFYGTDANCCDSKASTLHVLSLDFDFIRSMTDYYNSLGIEDPIEPPLPGMDDSHGQLPFSFCFPQNLKGEEAKQKLISEFFLPVQDEGSYRKQYVRKDISPCAEQYQLYDKIEKAKEAAQGMNSDETIKRIYRYTSGSFSAIYKVAQKENGKFGAQIVGGKSGVSQWSDTILEHDTFDEAQRALDDYAAKSCNVLHLVEEEDSEPEQTELSDMNPDDIPADAETKSTESEEAEPVNDQPCDTPDSDNPSEDYADGSDTTTDIDDQDEDEPDPDIEPDPDAGQLPDDPDLSLRLPAFDAMFNTADDALRDMARTLKTKYIESGELNIKIAINNYGGVLKPDLKKSKVDCALKPAKVSVPIRFSNDVEFVVDDDGRVILPDDRERQMSFDDLQDNDVTTTVDGSTNLVEDVDTGDESEDNDTADEDPTVETSNNDPDQDTDPATEDNAESPSEENRNSFDFFDRYGQEENEPVYSCENIDCPFWGLNDETMSGECRYNDGASMDADYLTDISEAAKSGCAREDVIRRNDEIERKDAE